MKLIKYLLQAGVGTRKECETYIKENKIYVNGNIITDYNYNINEHSDSIKINTKKITSVTRVYIALNKPAGFICSVNDEQGRPTVLDIIKKKKGKLYPVGRLDFNSEGLIFLTNDGDWANKITHPSNNIEKVYSVKIYGENIKEKIKQLNNGINIKNKLIKPLKVFIKKLNPKTAWIEIHITSGENRIIRRLCEKNNLNVSKLIRTKIGTFTLKGLNKGEYKILDYKVAARIINT